MRRFLSLIALTGLVAAQEPAVRDEVVKKVREMLSASKDAERQKLVDELCAQKDLDWPSVKKELQAGPYYQNPLVTEFGERSSVKHLGLSFRRAASACATGSAGT